MHGRRFLYFLKNLSFRDLKKEMIEIDKYTMLEKKAKEAENLVAELRNELTTLRTVVNAVKAAGSSSKIYESLQRDNEALKREIEVYKAKLQKVNVANSSQVQLNTSTSNDSGRDIAAAKEEKAEKKKDEGDPNNIALVKEKQAKGKKSAHTAKASAEEKPIDFSRLDIRVGKIIDVKKHPDADALYVEQVEVGESQPRTVISGLVKYVPIEKMQDRMVLLLCNLKPVKMRGILSEAMVMCASTPENVEILSPPEGSVPGDVVEVTGFPRNPDAVLNPKHKIFETVAPDLKTNDQKIATYQGVAWNVPGKGFVTASTLTGVNIK